MAEIGVHVPEVSQSPNIRPSAILNLCSTFLDHPRSIFAGLHWYAKFAWNSCSSFRDTNVSIFCAFGLKMPIHAPKALGTKSPKTTPPFEVPGPPSKHTNA